MDELTSGTKPTSHDRTVRFPWRVTVTRGSSTAAGSQHRFCWRRLGVVVGAVGLTLGMTALPASATSTSGGTTVTITVAVRSLQVSPGAISFDQCFTNAGVSSNQVLSFPNGACVATTSANMVTISNGPVPGHIEIQGSDAVPADGGTHWTLCGGTASAGGVPCATTLPGQDQFLEVSSAGGHDSPDLTTSPQCDNAFTGTASGCQAAAGQISQESLVLNGPSASTDPSAQFTTVWTWTVVP